MVLSCSNTTGNLRTHWNFDRPLFSQSAGGFSSTTLYYCINNNHNWRRPDSESLRANRECYLRNPKLNMLTTIAARLMCICTCADYRKSHHRNDLFWRQISSAALKGYCIYWTLGHNMDFRKRPTSKYARQMAYKAFNLRYWAVMLTICYWPRLKLLEEQNSYHN